MKFAPRDVFETILEWAVIPTFDLIIEFGDEGYIFVKRKIAPYKNQWAFPGLRMYKGESIDDTLERVALQELGIVIQPKKKILLGQVNMLVSLRPSIKDKIFRPDIILTYLESRILN